MTTAQVMNLTKTSQNFPSLSEPQISRQNIIQTIETVLDGETEIVFIEGAPGSGKTILLSQFALMHSMHTFSLFVKPTSRWAYDPLSLQLDLCNQLEWLLSGIELADPEQVDDSFLRTRLYRLTKHAKRTRETFYFVVDGLDEIPEDGDSIRHVILQMLPFGLDSFRFLISGDASLFASGLHKGLKYKPYPLTGFTLDQTSKYFNDLSVPRRELEEIHNICAGIPGHLASVRRILQTGVDSSTLVSEMPHRLPDLFDIEWRAVNMDDERQVLMLAIMAHDRRLYYIADLARLVGFNEQAVREVGQSLAFLTIDFASNQVAFVSEAFRQFAAVKLRAFKEQAHEVLIDDLMQQPDSAVSLTYLPGYLEKLGRYSELFAYLNQDNLMLMLHQGQSINLIRQKLDLGLQASERTGRDGEFLRFGVQSSAIRILTDVTVWRSEVEALMALDDYESALALAQGMVSLENRLHLLAVLAKTKHERGLSIESELDEQIRQLCKAINMESLGEQAVEIAADLIQTHPDIAIELVEKSTSSGDDENAMDWAMARLSLQTVEQRREAEPTDVAERIRQRIRDPRVRRFSATASMLLGDHTADEAISEARKLERASDQLYLLRLWAVENREQTEAWRVSEYGLQLMLKTPDYSPNARVFRELATPLPYVSDINIKKRLIGGFDAQKTVIERAGPTEDYVRLELLLAHSESSYDTAVACNRIIEIYHYIIALEDLSTQVGCLARLIAALEFIDPDFSFEPETGVHTIALSDLEENVNRLLSATASHFHTTRRIIRALAKTKADLALDISSRLNTEPRRDQLLLEFVKSAIRSPVAQLDFEHVAQAIDDICDPKIASQALLETIAQLASSDKVTHEIIERSLLLITRLDIIDNAGMRCNACALAHGLLIKHASDTYSTLAEHLLRQLERSWHAVDPGYARVNIGFKIVESLAPLSPDLATAYLRDTNEFRNSILIDSSETASAYDDCLKLAARALGGLVRAGVDTEEDLNRFARLLDEFYSHGHRAALWGELALHYYLSSREEKFKSIVIGRLKPLLSDLSHEDQQYRSRIIIVVAPALYSAHKLSAKEIISTLTSQQQDQAYSAICTFILQKSLPSDPYDTMPGSYYRVSYEEILDLCEILQNIRADHAVYHYIEEISKSVYFRRNDFSREQRLAVAEYLKRLVITKFPNPDFIKHNGYTVIGLAQVARIAVDQTPSWQELAKQARKIDNLSDRALVLCKLASSMPSKKKSERKRLLDEAESLIRSIPSLYERVVMYEGLAQEATQVDPTSARRYLKAAMESTIASNSADVRSAQRKLIDFAHRLDPDLAASLVSLLNEDRAIKRFQRRLEILNFKKQVANQSLSETNILDRPAIDYAETAWTLLGLLNANRIWTAHFDNLRVFVKAAAELPLRDGYPIYSMVLENAIRRWSNSTEQSALYLRPFYSAFVEGTQLTLSMGTQSSQVVQRAKRHSIKTSTDASILVRPGDRDKAIEFIQKWLERSLRDYLKICDPYFGPEDLEVLQLLLSINPSCRVYILTSREHHKKVDEPWESTYHDYWCIHISDQDPPDTEIVVAGTDPYGRLPVHDRWWLTNGGGIRIGTSFNSLGIERASEVSILTEEEVEIREADIDQYLRREKRENNGKRLRYTMFML